MAKHVKFWNDYDSLTVGQIMAAAARGDETFRQEIVARERRGRNRDAVIMPLVNWNS